eukprot:12103062-Ditylum_brightwellii.AAC.1
MSLETGKRIHGFQWTELAITDEVIKRVHELAEEQKADFLDENGVPKLSNIPGHNLSTEETDVEDESSQGDSTYAYDDVTVSSTSSESSLDSSDDSLFYTDDLDDSEEDKGMDTMSSDADNEESLEGSERSKRSEDIDDTAGELRSEDAELRSKEAELRSKEVEPRSKEVEQRRKTGSTLGEDDGALDANSSQNDEVNDDKQADTPRGRPQRDRRPPQDPLENVGSMEGKSYMQTEGFNFTNLKEDLNYTTTRQLYSKAVDYMFNKMTATEGIKIFQERAVAALIKEYKQLNDLCVLGVVDYNSLTKEQKSQALRAINLIKEKRDGKIKGRCCSDGISQRKYVPREEA